MAMICNFVRPASGLITTNMVTSATSEEATVLTTHSQPKHIPNEANAMLEDTENMALLFT